MNSSIAQKINDHFGDSNTMAYKKGKIITLANQQPNSITFLLEGVVEQYDITPEGNKIVVNMYKPQTFFPMSWAINKTPNTYFYAALTDIKIKQASANETVAFLQDNPDVTFDLLSRVYRGTDALLKRLVLASSGIASSRLIFELLIEAYRFGGNDNEVHKTIKVRHSSLASRSGLARETVSRELHKLQDEGSIKLTKQGIEFNIEKLEQKIDVTI